MKFKKYTNFIHLIIAIIISFILSYIFLINDINVVSSYLLSNSISILIFVVMSILYRKKVERNKCVQATLKKCEYSFLSNCNLMYEFDLNGKQENAIYHYAQQEKENKEEQIYISKDNKRLYRKRDITLFYKRGLIILSIISIIFLLLSFYKFEYGVYDLNEDFQKIFLFKFMNLLPIFALIIINVIIKKMKIRTNVVDGKVIAIDIRTGTDFGEIGGINTVKTYDMGTPKYEYIWKGEKKIYVSNTSSTNIPKIGSIKKLYVNAEGIVVTEKGELTFLIFFAILLIIFYIIGILSIF